jgi:type I restriction enzyme M protein
LADDGFSVLKTFEELKKSGYSFNPGGYFDVKVEYDVLSPEEFSIEIDKTKTHLKEMFSERELLEKAIISRLDGLKYE